MAILNYPYDLDAEDGPNPGASAICSRCLNLRDTRLQTCNAFPKGIPDIIWRGDNDHKKPFPGDGGIMFDPIPGDIDAEK